MSEKKKILELRKLKKYFPVAKGVNLKAVEDVSFVVYEGEKFGIVGESGCGKSTLGRTILQLYEQTSGSCTYYGKSIQEINPKYISANIKGLEKKQEKARELYKKSQTIGQKIDTLRKSLAQYDPDHSSKDAKKYDSIEREIAKLEFDSKELKKDASRQLREGSRTVGSLILCRDLDKVCELFLLAQNETQKAHEAIEEFNKAKIKKDEVSFLIDAKRNADREIKFLKGLKELSEERELRLRDLLETKEKVKNLKEEDLLAQEKELEEEMNKVLAKVNEHKDKESALKQEAFDKYHGKDILPITERALDPKYQEKLDKNYETGINLSKLTKKELRDIRPDMQMVFQDPAASMDPRQTIGKAIEEPFALHTNLTPAMRKEKTLSLLHDVDLKPEHYYVYPHSLSGGMKQRAGIARAIALDPSVVVLDEAVSALDVSVQAQILQLLEKLRKEKNLTYLFITHDLGVVKHFCDRVLVMYLGNVCELADAKDLFKNPLHPYTSSLLAAVPHIDVEKARAETKILEGEVPSPINPPKGCPFHTRCPKCMEICKKEKPAVIEKEKGHFVACHLYDEKEG